VTVWDPRVISDPDPAMLADMADHDLVVTVEDGARHGGAGMFVADAMRRARGPSASPGVVVLGLPRSYLPHGRPDDILAGLRLDGPGLAGTLRELAAGGEEALVSHPARLVRDPAD
jgi:1-deoxy-D-xylulose-5-phosphate synthase